MREILFRGKRIDNGEWVYGYYIAVFSHSIVDNRGVAFEVESKTIGQYTGLTDKNGKKIFEGDICKGNEYSDEDNLFIIKYGNYKTDDWKEKYVSNTYQFGWYAEFINTKKQVHLVSPNGIEVIGNIFDKEESE